MGRGRGRGRGRGKRMVTSAEDLALRNEQQAAYQQKRAARRGEDGEDASESEDDLPEFDAEAAEAMRNARDTSEKTTKKKSTTEGLIKTANPNAPQKQHMKMSQLDGSKPELTRREREELDRQRRAAAYAKKHAAGQTDEAKADLERLRAAKARREAAEASRAKETEEEARQKALAKAQMEMMQGAQTLDKVGTQLAKELGKGSFFEVADEAPPKLDKRKVKKMKPAQLKEELKLRGLSIQGNAKELVARLTEAAC
jgi:hypothetical protein